MANNRVSQRQWDEWVAKGLIKAEPSPGMKDLEPDLDEKEFQRRFDLLLDEQRWLHYHTRNSRKSKDGYPDTVALRDDVQLVVELKVEPNKPSKAQLVFLRAYEKIPGTIVRVWYPQDWEEVKFVVTHGKVLK